MAIVANSSPLILYAKIGQFDLLQALWVLLAAKRRGILEAVRPVVNALMTAGLRLDTRLYRRTLEQAGELADSTI